MLNQTHNKHIKNRPQKAWAGLARPQKAWAGLANARLLCGR